MQDAKGVYSAARDTYLKAQTMADGREMALKAMYDAAVKKVKPTAQQLRNNYDTQLAVIKTMFSDEVAGNAAINTTLKAAPEYKGFASSLSPGEKARMHEAALGMNYMSMIQNLQRYGGKLDSLTVSQMLNREKETFEDSAVRAFLYSKMGTTLADRTKGFGTLIAQDGNVSGMDSSKLQVEQLEQLAIESIKGKTNLEELVARPGLSTKWDMKKAA